MRKTTKTAAPVQADAASKTNSSECITAPSRRPPARERFVACLASKFWRPIAVAQLAKNHAGQPGAGESNAAAGAMRPKGGGRVQ